MNTNQCDIGLIGLAVMGENMVLNMESPRLHGRRVQPDDGQGRGRTEAQRARQGQEAGGRHQPEGISIGQLGVTPRKIMMMVKAGPTMEN